MRDDSSRSSARATRISADPIFLSARSSSTRQSACGGEGGDEGERGKGEKREKTSRDAGRYADYRPSLSLSLSLSPSFCCSLLLRAERAIKSTADTRTRHRVNEG